MGFAPQSAAKDASPLRRSMFSPAVTSIWPAWPVEIPSSCTVLGAAVATSCSRCSSSAAISPSSVSIRCAIDRNANFAASIGPVSSVMRKRAQIDAFPGSEQRAGHAAVGVRDEHVSDLDQGGAASFDGTVAGDPQHPDHFHDPVGLLRGRGRVAGEQQTGGRLRIGRISLADPPTGVRMRLVDFPHSIPWSRS